MSTKRNQSSKKSNKQDQRHIKERTVVNRSQNFNRIVVPDTSSYNIAVVDDKPTELDRICQSKNIKLSKK